VVILYRVSANMLDGLRPVSTADCACKICGNPASLYGVVDFHKSCEEARGVHFSLSGIPIYYRRCNNCNFLFTDAFDDWTNEQFKVHIYNEEYKLVDPDYSDLRPRENARAVARLWGAVRNNTRVLDYGGGNDAFCAALREAGFSTSVTYDPMVPKYSERPAGKYDLVTSFETFEHLPDPLAGIESIHEFLADPGLIFFTTLLQPTDFDQRRLNWWYVGPRNGHISLFSRQALKIAWERYGYTVASLADNVHFAFRTLPSYLAHLQPYLPNASLESRVA
jgi:SAM-dependent methyltransferase